MYGVALAAASALILAQSAAKGEGSTTASRTSKFAVPICIISKGRRA
jgi:hypothetical protein